jgi:hypothetical protein
VVGVILVVVAVVLAILAMLFWYDYRPHTPKYAWTDWLVAALCSVYAVIFMAVGGLLVYFGRSHLPEWPF